MPNMKRKLACDECERTFYDPSPKMAADMLDAHKTIAHKSRVIGADFNDPLKTCNACDFREMAPDDPRGYCRECIAETRAAAFEALQAYAPRDEERERYAEMLAKYASGAAMPRRAPEAN